MRIRDKATDFLMIIGLTISFLVVVYGIGIYNSAMLAKTATEKAKFKNEYVFTPDVFLDKNEDMDADFIEVSNRILSVLEVSVGNVSVPWGGIEGQSILPFEGLLYIKMNEAPKKKLEWGRYPTKEEMNQNVPVIVVNDVMLNYATQNEEKYYLDVCGDKYEIIGVLDDAYESFVLGEIILFYDCLGTKSKDTFYMDLYRGVAWSEEVFKYESDKNISEQYCKMVARAKDAGIGISNVPSENEAYETDWYTTLIKGIKSLFSALVFAFSVFNCCSISLLWIKHRLKEYSVRKAFGYSTFQLCVRTVKELIPLVLASAVITSIIQLVNVYGFGAETFFTDNILLLIIVMLLSIFIAMVVPFVIVAKVKPATGIKEL